MLQTLREHQLYAKLEKCEFFKTEIQYLGHVISKEGIAVDPKKIHAISEWPVPKDVTDDRSFMGLTGYYRRFIEGFSKIAYPITSLQKKGVKFAWTSRCQESFDQLKELLTRVPVLKVVDPLKNYTVYIDASLQGVGGVLSQDEHVVCYESCKLKEHERNYVVHDLELTAVVHALKMWWNYLLGNKFLLLTDNTCMKNLFMQCGLNAWQARWLAFLSEFDFEVRHIKGKENKVADALSWRTHGISEIILSQPRSDLLDMVKEPSTQDANYNKLLSKIQNNEINMDRGAFKVDQKGFIWFKDRLYVPNVLEIKLFIMNEMHNLLL